jgi:hypothetical protein
MQATDDAGEYRITGLMPGTYWVVAVLRETWSVTENGKTEQFGYAPTYAPGTTNVNDGSRLEVAMGAEVRAADFSLVPGRAGRVSGFALDSQGRPLAGGSVGISQEIVGTGGGFFTSVGGGSIGPDGAFSIANVPPGEYKIRANSARNREPGAAPEIVTQVLQMDGRDVEGLQLTSTAGWGVKGRVRVETGEAPPFARSGITLMPHLVSPELEPRASGMFPDSQIREDWTFSLTNIFGPSRLTVSLPSGWAVKSVVHGGRDIADEPLDAASGEDITDVEILVTNRVTRVTGQVTDDASMPIDSATVLLFGVESAKWFERSRWIRAVRPGSNGSFEAAGLPAGEYFAVALDYAQEGVWNDPEYLRPLSERAQKVALREGESLNVSLRVINAPQ